VEALLTRVDPEGASRSYPAVADIVLTTLNARYSHAALGLRYLLANLGELEERASLVEFTIQERPIDIAEAVLATEPIIVGLGVYIWNAVQTLELVKLLKSLRPELVVVLGGPEVSHECDRQELVRLADYTICGEADLAFADLCRQILRGERPRAPILRPSPPDLASVQSPYRLYTDEDLAHRATYVEASRGCPFACEFCLSSLDERVRTFSLPAFLDDMRDLLDRGASQIRFIDRTFNLNMRVASAILEFFLAHEREELFVHFEMVPDRLPAALREPLRKYRPGSLQLELGIQTFDPGTAERISRRQKLDALEDNLRFLRRETGAHIHADLIVGLPGEDLDSFARGFDRLVDLDPQEIQVGILKRLRGTPITRHTDEFGMIYSPLPPYEILENANLEFAELQRLKRFARLWDLVANSGNFRDSKSLIWVGDSPFFSFLRLTDWTFERVGAFKGIALTRLAELVCQYLVDVKGIPEKEAKTTLARDYARAGRRLPGFLAGFGASRDPAPRESSATPPRQAKHLA